MGSRITSMSLKPRAGSMRGPMSSGIPQQTCPRAKIDSGEWSRPNGGQSFATTGAWGIKSSIVEQLAVSSSPVISHSERRMD